MWRIRNAALVAAFCLILVGCASLSSEGEKDATGAAKPTITENSSKAEPVNLMDTGLDFFAERSNYVPDPQRIMDLYDLMDEGGKFPCVRDAQATIPMAFDEPNGELSWCQVLNDEFKILEKIPYPENVPKKGFQLGPVVRDGDKLLFIMTGAQDASTESNWYLVYYDGATSRVISQSNAYGNFAIKNASEPWYLGLCGGKAYWATYDMAGSEKKENANIGILFSQDTARSAVPKLLYEDITSFNVSESCDIVLYSQSESQNGEEESAKYKIIRNGETSRSINIKGDGSKPYLFKNMLAYTQTSSDGSFDLVIINLKSNHADRLTDIPGYNSYLYGLSDEMVYLEATQNEKPIVSYIYDIKQRRFYSVPQSYVGVSKVPSSNCNGKARCFLLSRSTSTDIPGEMKKQHKVFLSTQSYVYWSPL